MTQQTAITVVNGPAVVAGNASIASFEGSGVLHPNEFAVIFQVPTGASNLTFNYRLISHAGFSTNASVRAAIVPEGYSPGTDPGPAFYILPQNLQLGPNGVPSCTSEDTGVIMGPGQSLVCWTDTAGVSVRFHGFLKTPVSSGS